MYVERSFVDSFFRARLSENGIGSVFVGRVSWSLLIMHVRLVGVLLGALTGGGSPGGFSSAIQCVGPAGTPGY